MNSETLAEIRNKLTVPRTALEKIHYGEEVPQEFIELAIMELNALEVLLKRLESS